MRFFGRIQLYCITFLILIIDNCRTVVSFSFFGSFHNYIQQQKSFQHHVYSTSKTWEELRDEAWLTKANAVKYILDNDGIIPVQSEFSELAEEIGLNVSSNFGRTRATVIPFHLTSATDLFCNRELNMQQIEAVGFDMDWTLAQYNEAFDLLAYNGAKEKLITLFNYPKETLELEYRQDMHRRGCLVDKQRGT